MPELPLPDDLARIIPILVRARNPNNIGAVARALHDFGFPTLRLVNDYPVPLEAARSAIDASAVLHAATAYATVAEAVADCTLIVGTTAVGERDLQHRLLPLAEAAPLLLPTTPAARTALLFGSEKTGLSNEELSHCHFLLTIPMHLHPGHRHPSMNLGQAVAVCLYEIVRSRPLTHTGRAAPPSTAAEIERLTTLLTQVLEASEYLRHHPANATPADLRRLLTRLSTQPPDQADTPVLMGILRQVLWKLRQNPTPQP